MGDSNINEAITSTDNDVSYVTPEQFGAVGNGVNDDTEALKAMFSAAQTSGQQVVLKSGCTYLISEELEYTVAKANFNGNWATIKVADSVSQTNRLNSVINIKVLGGIDARYNMGSFCNLIIDCNLGRATHAIRIDNEGKTNYSHIFVKNPAVYGIRSYGGNEASFTYIHGCRSGISEPAVSVEIKKSAGAEGSNQPPDRRLCSTMLYLGCADTYVSDCVAVDFENGFLTGAADNHFNKCHAWCAYNENIMQYATSFVIWGGVATFTQCMVDSTKYGFEFFNAGRAMITNCLNGYNSVYINPSSNPSSDSSSGSSSGSAHKFGSPYVLYYATKELTAKYKSTNRGTGTVVTNCKFKSPFTSESGITCKFDNLGNTGDGLVSIDYRPLGLDSVHVTALDDLSRMVNGEKVVTPNTNQVSMVKSSKCRYIGHNGIINAHLIIVLNQCTLENNTSIHITDMPFANAGDKEIVVGVTSKGTLLKAAMETNSTAFSITSLSGDAVNFADDEEIHFNLTYKYNE